MAATANQQRDGFDARDLRAALGTFATGVTIVTTRAPDGRLYGLTANSFTSVSLDPPLVLWSQSRSAPSVHAFDAARRFAVNVLGSEHRELSARFAGLTNRSPDKFEGIAYHLSDLGLPLIDGAAAHFECTIENRFEGGDHVIILGRVERYAYEHKPTLLFCHGRYHRAHPLDDPDGGITGKST